MTLVLIFASAMALLGKTDKEPASYLDIAEFIANKGVQGYIDTDLRELFRRVLFNVMTANRDDHLRNHGFIRYPGGWRLAPAFDMNPSTRKHEHVLALDDVSTEPDLDTVLATAELYRLNAAEAQDDLNRMKNIVNSWAERAKRLGMTAEDRLELEDCFLA